MVRTRRSGPIFSSRGVASLLALNFLLGVDLAAQQPTVLIDTGALWKYFKGTEAPPTEWKNLGFDDATWLEGATGIGYADGDDATVLSDMQNGYMAFFARRTFSVPDLAAVTSLLLEIDFDDGYVAYLNGTEIIRENMATAAPNPVPFDEAATSHDAGTFHYITVALAALQQGNNVLAIELHNTSIGSSDASLIPRLVANGSAPPTGLACAANGGVVTLTWTNNPGSGTYDSIRVLRNGTVIANLGGTETTYTDSSAGNLDLAYQVIATADGVDYPVATGCTFGCTAVTLTCSLKITEGFTEATLNWTPIAGGAQSIEVRREGAALATVDATATQYVDPNVESDQAEDDTEYTIVITKSTGETCTVHCGPITLCPQNLLASVVGGKIQLSWGNVVKVWDHYEISRGGTVVDAVVPGSATSWTDSGLVLEVGNSYDYILHPVAVGTGSLGTPGTQCDLTVTFSYLPELARYNPPTGGWDYELKFSAAGKPQYNATAGEKGNLDGQWIRSAGRDQWDGSGPFEVGPAPEGPAPGGIDIVSRPGVGACGTSTTVLRLLDPGDPGAVSTAFPTAFNAPNNSRIFLAYDLGFTSENLLATGITFAARLRTSPVSEVPAYMAPNAVSGDGGTIHNGTGHVGVYYRSAGGTGTNVSAAFALESSSSGGNVEFSASTVTDVDSAGIQDFISIWMTVRAGTAADTYDVNVYMNGSLIPSADVGGTGIALQGSNVDFGANVMNYLAIGSNDTGQDAMIDIEYVAYKRGIWSPSVTPCGSGEPNFKRGDGDANGTVNITDAISVLNFLFLGGIAPPCMDAADTDNNGAVNITDAISLLNHLFLGGPAPAAPGMSCGPDPATPADSLATCVYTNC
jgi:hypothetical protein